ncbi:peptide deformylase [bacterium]|nr:peptide deformylase [bacterium]
MKQLKILTIEDPKEEEVLRTPSIKVTPEELKTEEFQKFLDNLLHTALTSEEQVGIQSGGISAPQVGVNKKVIYILDYDTNEFELLINPQIQNIGTKTNIDMEGCLSIPNVEGNVERYSKIKVKYMNKDGNTVKRRFNNINARVVQHENDHLEGILFIDKTVD